MIAIINYGFGNTGSIQNMIRKIGYDAVITNDFSEMKKAEKLILPGVGSFDHAMKALKDLDLVSKLNQLVLDEKKPILGICLGMQLMTHRSEEGILTGLGWMDAETVRFIPQNPTDRIPHMGWNEVVKVNHSPLTEGFDESYRYYFVHSYHVQCASEEDVILKTHYIKDIHVGFQKENIFGVQFHPEKSHRFGMHLMKNYVGGVGHA